MNVYSHVAGMLEENTFLAVQGDAALFVDPGTDTPWLREQVAQYAGKVQYILLTHRHADHLMAAAWLRETTGAPLVIHEADAAGLTDDTVSMARDLFPQAQRYVNPDRLVRGGETLPFWDLEIQIIATPGHSIGSVCYQIGDALFVGDTLFAGSMGRTDFPSGSNAQMAASLALLRDLPGDFQVYPGHGPNTTLNKERATNPYMCGLL